MPTIKYISFAGEIFEADVTIGDSVMQGAIDNMVDGILADCGGACACATCHCYVDEQWVDKIPIAEDVEQEMLAAVVNPKSTSRLSCQLKVTENMDGFTVHLPETQY